MGTNLGVIILHSLSGMRMRFTGSEAAKEKKTLVVAVSETYRESTSMHLELVQACPCVKSPRFASSILNVSKRLGKQLKRHCIDAEQSPVS